MAKHLNQSVIGSVKLKKLNKGDMILYYIMDDLTAKLVKDARYATYLYGRNAAGMILDLANALEAKANQATSFKEALTRIETLCDTGIVNADTVLFAIKGNEA